MHLTIFAYYSSINGTIENAVPRVDGWSAPACRAIKRCEAPKDVLPTVKNAVRDAGARYLEKLDIYGHGRPGVLILSTGKKIEWAPESKFWIDLEELGEWLSPTAHVRLIGCDTGTCQKGFDLVKALASRLGKERVVSAPRATINPDDFVYYGLKEEVARDYLVASHQLTSPVPGVIRPCLASGKNWESFGRWIELLKPGYVPQGYDNIPAAIPDAEGRVEDVTVAVSGERRVIAITPVCKPDSHFLLRWLSCDPAPSLDALSELLGVKLTAI